MDVTNADDDVLDVDATTLDVAMVLASVVGLTMTLVAGLVVTGSDCTKLAPELVCTGSEPKTTGCCCDDADVDGPAVTTSDAV